MGGVGGAFARHADQVAASVPPQPARSLLRAIMTRLVTPEGTRAVVDHKELLGLSGDPDEVERILDQLVARAPDPPPHRSRPGLHRRDRARGADHRVADAARAGSRRARRCAASCRSSRQATKQWAARGKPNDLVWRGAHGAGSDRDARSATCSISRRPRREFLARRAQAASRRGAPRQRFVALSPRSSSCSSRCSAVVRTSPPPSSPGRSPGRRGTRRSRPRTGDARPPRPRPRRSRPSSTRSSAPRRWRSRRGRAPQGRDRAAAGAGRGRARRRQGQAVDRGAQAREHRAQEGPRRRAGCERKKPPRRTRTSREEGDRGGEERERASCRALLAAEQARVKQLELEKSKIATGGLK